MRHFNGINLVNLPLFSCLELTVRNGQFGLVIASMFISNSILNTFEPSWSVFEGKIKMLFLSSYSLINDESLFHGLSYDLPFDCFYLVT